MPWYMIAALALGFLAAVPWMLTGQVLPRRRPQPVDDLGMRIATLEHDCEMAPPFEHPRLCPGCRPVWAPRSNALGGLLNGPGALSAKTYRDSVEDAWISRRKQGGVVLAANGLLSPDEVRQIRERWASNDARPVMVLDEGAVFRQVIVDPVLERLDEAIAQAVGVPNPRIGRR
jgi:hypothetical protein